MQYDTAFYAFLYQLPLWENLETSNTTFQESKIRLNQLPASTLNKLLSIHGSDFIRVFQIVLTIKL